MSAYALPGLFPPVGKVSFNSLPLGSFDTTSSEEKTDYLPVIPQLQPSRIRVTNAKADPVKLIQSITRGQCNLTAARNKCRARLLRRHQDRHPAAAAAAFSPHEDAMHFTLSVSHHGRQYTAVRSLARIRQLQVDLSKEASRGLFDNDYDYSSLNSPCVSTHTQKTGSRGTHHRSQVRIPELPAIHKDCKSLGFTLLQDLLRSYSPSLEEWFRKVLGRVSAVDDSTALTDFLYEPLDYPKSIGWEKRLYQSMFLHAKLYAIEESDSEEEEKEEEADTE